MKLVVATRKGQGRPGDFFWCVEGEPVVMVDMCDRDINAREMGEEDEYPGCGCSRAFGGMSSGTSTTTAVVIDSPLTREEFTLAFHTSQAAMGLIPEVLEVEDMVAMEEEIDWLLALADEFEVGTILERDFEEIRVREVHP